MALRLDNVITSLRRAADKRRPSYRIPAVWNGWGYDGPQQRDGKELLVDPHACLASCLAWIRDRSKGHFNDTVGNLSSQYGITPAGRGRVKDGPRTRRAGDWIRRQTVYTMMVRTTTAWDHDGNGRLAERGVTRRGLTEQGTFLKSILLLPLLEKLGVTTLYLLPVVKVSQLYRKGELGCPYATKNFFTLDAGQHDTLLPANGRHRSKDADPADEFALLIECAHRLGMRVILDIAPRTAARDSDWILDHPAWFYWIDRRTLDRYRAPRLPEVDYPNPIPGRLGEIYASGEVKEHLQAFRFPPSVTAPREWTAFVKDARRRPPADLMAAIADQFNVITPPGFSDVINDRQPPWSDVTFLRLFLDHPSEAIDHLDDPGCQPPYVLFDTIKASRFPGRVPNRPLWDALAGIIPFYQKLGIDGARLDMAHALPGELERMILDRCRERDPDFCLLAEDLGTDNHASLHKAGYNMMVGPCWYLLPRAHEGRMHDLVPQLPKLKIPITAAAETPDTPRAASRTGGRKFARQAIVISQFLPNAVPAINTGQEVLERQPMNLGLDCVPPGRDALPKNDPQAGRLAFFDPYALHWTNPGARAMLALIEQVARLRREYVDAIMNPRAFFTPKITQGRTHVLTAGYHLGRSKGQLLMLANVDLKHPRRCRVGGLKSGGASEVRLELYESASPRLKRGVLSTQLPAGDVKMVVIQ